MLYIVSIKYCPSFMHTCTALPPPSQGRTKTFQEQVSSCVCEGIQTNFTVHCTKSSSILSVWLTLPCHVGWSLHPSLLSHAKLVCLQTPSLPLPFKLCHRIVPVPGLVLSSLTGQIFFHKKKGLDPSFYDYTLKGLQRWGNTFLRI